MHGGKHGGKHGGIQSPMFIVENEYLFLGVIKYILVGN
jgi:hypothetical protein